MECLRDHYWHRVRSLRDSFLPASNRQAGHSMRKTPAKVHDFFDIVLILTSRNFDSDSMRENKLLVLNQRTYCTTVFKPVC